jgi:apolipoprotein N-acyltransferase
MHRLEVSRQASPWRTMLTSPLYLLKMVAVLVAGVAHAASLAWPLSSDASLFALLGLRHGQPAWWLQLLALGTLAWLLDVLRDAGPIDRRDGGWRFAVVLSWLFTTAWLASTFWWTYVAMHTYGGLPAVLTAAAVISLAGLLALYYAGICGIFMVVAPVHKAGAAIVFAALWLLAEMARGIWLTGFGWGAAGYAHVEGPLAGLAPWVGAYGMCLVAAWVAMTLAQAVRGPVWRSRGVAMAVVLVVLAQPALNGGGVPDPAKSTGRLAVTLLQGNIPQDEKFEPGSGVPIALQWYGEQLQKSSTSLVVAPETAIPLLPQQLPEGYWAALQQRFATGQQAALIGMPLGNMESGYTNSVVGLKPGQTQPARYDKHHLVPFGEFIPPLFKWFTAMMNIPLGDFNRGALAQPTFDWQGQRLAANICYEDLFGEELGQLFVDPAKAPTIFVNISNLAWFGDSMAMDQHLQIARMRALEFQRPFVLATNTGTTAIMDHQGRVVSALARDTRGVLVGEVEGRTGVTPFAWWVARFGLWPFWLLGALVVGLAAGTGWRRRRSGVLALQQGVPLEHP